jgi:hypothetical protein
VPRSHPALFPLLASLIGRACLCGREIEGFGDAGLNAGRDGGVALDAGDAGQDAGDAGADAGDGWGDAGLLDAGACTGVVSNLQSAQGYVPSGGGYGMANSADFNGDGLLDVLVAGTMQSTGDWGFVLLFGLSDGGLSSPIFYPEGLPTAEGPLVAADVNGDGRPDVLCLGPDGIDILLNVGGTLTANQPLITTENGSIEAIAVGDLNGDRIPDVIVGLSANSRFLVNTFAGLGDGKFGQGVTVASLSGVDQTFLPATLFISDLNQDGLPDIVTAAYGGSQLGVLLQEVDGGYHEVTYDFPYPVNATALPRAGGAPDLVVGYDDAAQLLANTGDGSFVRGPTFSLSNGASFFAISDFNGDCIPDVAVGGYGGSGEGASVLFGSADGGFSLPQSLPTHGAGPLTVLGPVSNPQALAAAIVCCDSFDLVVYGGGTPP